MNLDVLEKGEIVRSVLCENGSVSLPSIGVDGDVLLYFGDIKEVEVKISLLKKSFSLLNKESSSLRVLPLYKKLSSKDCMDVFYMASHFTATGFVRDLTEAFDNNRLSEWLEKERRNKMF